MTSPCSLDLLESALAGNLPPEDETALHLHLETCEACGAALERMAGGAAWCQEAAALLSRDDLDAAVPAGESWSEVDFTVEHLEPADEPHVLGRLGGYDVLEVIGHGSMGVVLKALDRELKRCVAIKVLAPHLAHSSLAKKRFAREAQAAAAVVHPNVLAIHQVQPGGRLPFLVMPLVAGESLAQRLAAQGTLELKETLRIGLQVAAGLAAAHEQGLVHRDVKPANILLEKGVERAVLTDFGLACAADDVTLTRWGVVAGTPEYMSPEQARGEPLDGRSDLFSLGCVLYQMATGVSPFRADSMLATMRRLVDDAPQAMAALKPDLPPWFVAIVERLLEKDASRRFGSAKEVSELLEGCLAHMQQPASVALPAGLPQLAPRRAWRISDLGLKGVLAMIAAFGIGLLGILLLSADPPDIAGEWSDEEWGRVVLEKTGDGEYAGTYSDPVRKEPGKIQLEWSRLARRFNGTWRAGEDRFGQLSVRLVVDEIRGARTTDPKCKVDFDAPHLTDLLWVRAKPEAPNAGQGTDSAADSALRKSLEPFQGRWQFESFSQDSLAPGEEVPPYQELWFEFRQFVFSFRYGRAPFTGTVKSIDAGKSPAQIDLEMRYADPSEPAAGTRTLLIPAIFKFEGDRLIMAHGVAGKRDRVRRTADFQRPESFQSGDVHVTVWKRSANTRPALSAALQPRPASPAAAGGEVGSPAKEPGSEAGRTEGEQSLVAREIERLVQGVRVGVQENGAAKQVALLKGPLLRHDDRSAGVRYALGTIWAWGDGCRPAAILDLSLTGYADNPKWCFEMVSLSTRPVSAESRAKRWWATEGPGWNPRALPDAPQPGENAEARITQMKTLASRFAGYRVQWNGEELTPLTLLPEPILRYGNPLDGALFVFVIGDNNPEILLVLDAQLQPQGGSAWKYHCSPLTANGLVLKLDGQEAWTWSQIGDFQTQTSDPYRIYMTSAKDEVEEETPPSIPAKGEHK